MNNKYKMKINRIFMFSGKFLVLFLVGVFVFISFVLAQSESGAGVYYNTKTSQLQVESISQSGMQLQQATPEQMASASNTEAFLADPQSWHTATTSQQNEYLNHKNPNVNIEGAGNMDHSFSDGNNVLTDGNGVEQDLSNFQEGTELKITGEGMESTYEGGKVSASSGIGSFGNSKDEPGRGCLYEGSNSIGAFNVWPLTDECYANPDGGFEGLEYVFLPSENPVSGGVAAGFFLPLVSAQAPGGGAGGFGAGLGGGEGLGAVDQQFVLALTAVQQVLGALAPIFDTVRNNNQGETTIDKSSEGVAFGYDADAAIALQQEQLTRAGLQQKEKGTIGETLAQGNVLRQENSQTIIPGEGASLVDDSTTTNLNGISGNSEFSVATDSGEIASIEGDDGTGDESDVLVAAILSLFSGNRKVISSLTGEVVLVDAQSGELGQSINLEGHDVEISGHDINFYALKTFDELKAGGQDLHFYSGEVEVEFSGQRIMYPRLVKNAPYGAKSIKNKLDSNNEFSLQHYTNRKGELGDSKNVVSVGDISMNHPKERLIISKKRMEMFNN